MQAGTYTGVTKGFAYFSAASLDLAETKSTIFTLRIAISHFAVA